MRAASNPKQERHFYSFGAFRLYVARRELFREAVLVPLTPKAFDALFVLVSHHGHIVDKDELMGTLWPDTFVEEASLVQQISQLRKVLGERPDGGPYIETVARRGYRFAAPVTETWEEEPAGLRVAVRERSRRSLRLASAAATVLVLAVAGVFVWLRMQAKPLTGKDVLVLADFTNTTGDPVFDVTLREAFAVQLEQSPFLKVLGDEQMRQDLRLMGRPAGEHITNQIAREICQREGEKAMIGGSIASLGKTYAITLQATNCQTGETLAREHVEAEDKEHVLRAVATAAKGMRAKLGESLASIQERTIPPEQVSTTSLEAFQAYALGRAQVILGSSMTALPFFQRATELDPNFALAHRWLGNMWCNSGEYDRCAEHQKKAFALIDRVGERERLEILARYYFSGTGELNRAADTYQLLARTFPRDPFLPNALGLIHGLAGEWEKAVSEHEEAIAVAPRFAYAYSNLVTAYSCLGRFAEAKALAGKGLALGLDFPSIHLALLRIAYVQGDRAEAGKHIQSLAGTLEEYQSLALQAANAAALGQLRKGRESLERAGEMTRQQGLPETAARLLALEALQAALVGNCKAAHAKAGAPIPSGLPSSESKFFETSHPALPLALCGDIAAAQRAAEETSKQYPLHTLWNAVVLPTIRAAIELNREQPAKAIELLRSATPYERPYASTVYLRGLAYLRAGKGREAAVEFQKILDHKGANWGPYYPLSYVGLARAAVLTGDTARARKAYQNFLTLWKDADPDISILKEAQQEYAKLK